MTDTELLEFAAKAAGYSFDGYTLRNNNTEFEYSGWNPLEDDGDAFRLAVSLGLTVVVETDMVFCRNQRSDKVFREQSKDRCASTRKAIVRAAAEIGKVMK